MDIFSNKYVLNILDSRFLEMLRYQACLLQNIINGLKPFAVNYTALEPRKSFNSYSTLTNDVGAAYLCLKFFLTIYNFQTTTKVKTVHGSPF